MTGIQQASPIEFANMIVDEELAGSLSTEEITEYSELHDRFAADVKPYLYALRIENHLLAEYAIRMSIDGDISIMKPRRIGRAPSSKLTDR